MRTTGARTHCPWQPVSTTSTSPSRSAAVSFSLNPLLSVWAPIALHPAEASWTRTPLLAWTPARRSLRAASSWGLLICVPSISPLGVGRERGCLLLRGQQSVVLLVDHHHRRQEARAETGDRFEGELVVFPRSALLNAERAGDRLSHGLRATDVT